MDDPWDVKSVRNSNQYVSCLKINGVPLLPPILSKECRQEMQYYKRMAKEVENHLKKLKLMVNDSGSEDSTDPPLPETDTCNEDVKTVVKVPPLDLEKTLTADDVDQVPEAEPLSSPKLVIDLSFSINQTGSFDPGRGRKSQQSSPVHIPERDQEDLTHKNVSKDENDNEKIEKEINLKINIEKALKQESSSALISKRFTGSLIDIHESSKENNAPALVRQRSYTVLKPSPQLLAHLEVQSINTGIDVASISMSESMSNLSNTPSRKRRSWDLDSAKSKWSSMAIEMDESPNRARPATRTPSKTVPRAKSVDPYKKRQISNTKTWPNTEPRKPLAPHNQVRDPPQTRIPQMVTPKKTEIDPAARIRELYERLQNQQLVQMANLVEKQKQEQMMLQKIFEEQNSLFYKQLKTIAPKQPIPVKEAWVDQEKPVSLRQLIHTPETDISSTLTDTNNYINHCEDVLQRSRDITSSLKQSQDVNVTRTQSPVSRPRSTPRRRIVYDSSSSDNNGPILTDRTSDTMADLNVTFSTDDNEIDSFAVSVVENEGNKTFVNNINNVTVVQMNGVGNQRVERPGFTREVTDRERRAASTIVAYAKGYLTRRLMRTERVQGTVQTIRDALLCALQLHQDREGIRGADVDLHRRLIQQITAACYSLHETVVASPPAQRAALIAADRARQRTRATSRSRNASARSSFSRNSEVSMTSSYPAPAQRKRSSMPAAMTQSNYESYSDIKSPIVSGARCPSPRRRPWR